MKLIRIADFRAELELLTGLHIGAGDLEMRIGGVDNPVIKDPIHHRPYIPGSSLKGKIRSLLEWRSGAVREAPLSYNDLQGSTGTQREEVRRILLLFGMSGGDSTSEPDAGALGPTRVSFNDAHLTDDFLERIKDSNLPFTETKSENSINRITGTAHNPRQTERVPGGARFKFRVGLRVFEGDPDLVPTILAGLRLLELDSLGGSGSRGYGKVRFDQLTCDGKPLDDSFRAIEPFALSA